MNKIRDFFARISDVRLATVILGFALAVTMIGAYWITALNQKMEGRYALTPEEIYAMMAVFSDYRQSLPPGEELDEETINQIFAETLGLNQE